MGDVVVLETAQHMDDGVDLADVGEELVAQAFALRCAAHEAGDVDEGQPRRDDLRRLADRGELVEPRIGHRDLADIRLDGAERIVRRLRRRRLGQRVEQGRLADIGQADDTAFESHRSFRSFAPRERCAFHFRPSYAGLTRVSIHLERWIAGSSSAKTRSRLPGDDERYFSPPSPLSKKPFDCSARCTLFANEASCPVASNAALSAITSHSASTHGRSALAKSDSTC